MPKPKVRDPIPSHTRTDAQHYNTQPTCLIRKMAPTKKSKAAKSTESIAARLALVVKSGKYHLGYKSALKQMRNGKGSSDSAALCLGTGARG